MADLQVFEGEAHKLLAYHRVAVEYVASAECESISATLTGRQARRSS